MKTRIENSIVADNNSKIINTNNVNKKFIIHKESLLIGFFLGVAASLCASALYDLIKSYFF